MVKERVYTGHAKTTNSKAKKTVLRGNSQCDWRMDREIKDCEFVAWRLKKKNGESDSGPPPTYFAAAAAAACMSTFSFNTAGYEFIKCARALKSSESSRWIVTFGALLTPNALTTLKSLSPTACFCCAMDLLWIESINSSVERVTSGSALGSGKPVVATGLPPAILRISVAGSLARVASVWTAVVVEEEDGGMAMEVVLGVTGAAGEAATEGPRE